MEVVIAVPFHRVVVFLYIAPLRYHFSPRKILSRRIYLQGVTNLWMNVRKFLKFPTILNSLDFYSWIWGGAACVRHTMLLCHQLCVQAHRLSRLTNLSRCLSKGHVLHLSIHRKARPTSANRIPWLWSVLRGNTVSVKIIMLSWAVSLWVGWKFNETLAHKICACNW